jgi:tRNA (guanine-N7-)-methyltransferase
VKKAVSPETFRTMPLRSFGRQKGRPLSARQHALVTELLPQLAVPALPEPNFELRSVMPRAKAVWVEVGFGGGEHLIGQALAHPDVLCIGVEPYEEGVAKALVGISENNLANVRLLMDDSRPFLEGLAEKSVDRIFVLFPDPWPKPRQRKRRILQATFLGVIARILKPGGEFRFATDVESYAEWALELISSDDRFEPKWHDGDDLTAIPADHVTTRYQTKGLGDCVPVFLSAIRKAHTAQRHV